MVNTNNTKKLAAKIRSIEWYNAVQRPGFLQSKLIVAQGEAGSVELTSFTTVSFKQVIWVKFSNMWDSKSYFGMQDYFAKATKEDKKWPLRLVKRFESYSGLIESFENEMRRDWSQAAGKEKIIALRHYGDLIREIARHYVIAVPMTDYFENIVQQENPELLIYAEPYRKVDMSHHRDSLICIKKAQQEQKNTQSLIDEHLKRFAWIKTAYNEIDPYTKKDVVEELATIRTETPHHNLKEKPESLIGLQIGVFVRNRIKELCQHLWYAVEPLSLSIAHDLKLARDHYYQLTENEVAESLQKGRSAVTDSVIKERNKGFVTGLVDGETILFTGSYVEELYQHYNPSDFTGKTEVKGQIGCKGLVQGKVRIVLSHAEFPNLKAGEVLVTSMTTPDYIILMKKAAAIVTDEGGLASHAALISRELNIPCIIGTKIATKVFKDGDMVEVDANKGIVRKI